jgi:hypothetical protein
MQVIEMRMGDQHQINGRQIAEFYAGLAQSFQHKKPSREVRIDYDVLAAHLQEKTCMTNESNPHLAIGDQNRLVRFADSRGHSGVPYELPKLPRALAHSRTLDRLSQHKKASS